MRRKGDPRDPAHNRKHTKHSDACRTECAKQRTWNENEDPPNRAGRAARRKAERLKGAKKKAERVTKSEVKRAAEEIVADLIAGAF